MKTYRLSRLNTQHLLLYFCLNFHLEDLLLFCWLLLHKTQQLIEFFQSWVALRTVMTHNQMLCSDYILQELVLNSA